ncbi:hypothetical protein OBBRIDRAFT_808785, partial [Obba rivulosa]
TTSSTHLFTSHTPEAEHISPFCISKLSHTGLENESISLGRASNPINGDTSMSINVDFTYTKPGMSPMWKVSNGQLNKDFKLGEKPVQTFLEPQAETEERDV